MKLSKQGDYFEPITIVLESQVELETVLQAVRLSDFHNTETEKHAILHTLKTFLETQNQGETY